MGMAASPRTNRPTYDDRYYGGFISSDIENNLNHLARVEKELKALEARIEDKCRFKAALERRIRDDKQLFYETTGERWKSLDDKTHGEEATNG